MRARITRPITADNGTAGAVEGVALLTAVAEGAGALGLLLVEGKALLAAVRRRLVRSQVEAWARRRCEGHGRRRRSEGSAPITR